MIKYNKVVLSLLILLIGAKTIARDNNPQNQRNRQRRHNSAPLRNNSGQNRLHPEPQEPYKPEPQEPYKYGRRPRRPRPNTRRENMPKSQVAQLARKHRDRALVSQNTKENYPFSTILRPVAQPVRRRRK